MNISQREILQALQNFDFETLFIDTLGWDNAKDGTLTIQVDGQAYRLRSLAEKKGIKVYFCYPNAEGAIPDDARIRRIDLALTKLACEHITIHINKAHTIQVWLWVKRDANKPLGYRFNRWHKGQASDLLVQKLSNLFVSIEEELAGDVTNAKTTKLTKNAFDVEKVTKRFYDRFKLEHSNFLELIDGMSVLDDREWYTSLMLNRLMFIYFIQRKGFLGTSGGNQLDGDQHYLRHRLEQLQEQQGEGHFHSFYRTFLLHLFHDGLNTLEKDHTPETIKLLGHVPYLNGGLFDVHQLERNYTEIDIPDEAFTQIFKFFDEYDWHLDDRPNKKDNEINPDVLGYIFEKYINQKQMGAYYTKEDITEYISKNTIIPYLFEVAERDCSNAFMPDGQVWSLLRDNPDRYIYQAVKKSCELALPAEIERGIHDVAQRGEWNKPAPDEYALPTEIWREVVARRQRYEDVYDKLAAGEITSINDFITYNLDIRQFAQDVISYCEGPNLLLAFYENIEKVTVLDPTCGSGAFLFAALNILQPLYEACLGRMEIQVEERDRLDAQLAPSQRQTHYTIKRFRQILDDVAKHYSHEYFILKSIIIKNLYGVDIMEEAVEICKLRLFLKLAAQVQSRNQIEPLPDIDFNIRAGNTLVGFTSMEEVSKAGNLFSSEETLARIKHKAEAIERDFKYFRTIQTDITISSDVQATIKAQLRQQQEELNKELDEYLASEYRIMPTPNKPEEYETAFSQWKQSHRPFHWLSQFYGIMSNGGFNIIIGNPPYVEYSKVRKEYTIQEYQTEACGNLYASVMERCLHITKFGGRNGMIIPHSSFCTDRMEPIMERYRAKCKVYWFSTYCIRPAKLFVGVDQRLAVVVGQVGSENKQVFSTQYHHWHEEARENLFTTLEYACVTSTKFHNSIPKMHSITELAILRKLQSFEALKKSFVAINRNSLYFHNAPRYWIRALTFVPYFWNERGGESLSTQVKTLSFFSDSYANAVAAIINSSLFYWWFILLSDCRHLNMREIEAFPMGLDTLSEEYQSTLSNLCHELMDDYKKHAVRKETYYKTTGKVVYDEFSPRHSKLIIDEIDRVLAQHYGFTDEELDFIINYDIKYRMGRDDGDEDEE